MNVRPVALRPTKSFRPGRTVLDVSGPIHRSWIEQKATEDHLKILVYRSDFRSEEIELLPRHEGVQMISGDLEDVLARAKESVTLLVDDLGSFHFSDHPLELLGSYYDALAVGGEAWIRFPKSFWVFVEDGSRISLQEYIAGKLPSIAKSIRPSELDPLLAKNASSLEDWVLIKKDRNFPKIFFHLFPRTLGGTSAPKGKSHAPYLEFVERTAAKISIPLKRVA